MRQTGSIYLIGSAQRQNGDLNGFVAPIPRPIFNAKAVEVLNSYVPWPVNPGNPGGYLVSIKEIPGTPVSTLSTSNSYGTFFISSVSSTTWPNGMAQRIDFDYPVNITQFSVTFTDPDGNPANPLDEWWILLKFYF